MKIALVGSFNLADGYLGAAKALRREGHEVEFVPAQKYKSEQNKTHLSFVLEDLKRIEADVVLWWRAESLSGNEFSTARKEIDGKFIMFSWDDPLQWEHHREMPEKSALLDVAYTCCASSVNNYLRCGAKKAVYCPPGFDPEVHYPDFDPEYECDISLVCTNLYHGGTLTSYTHLSRRKLIDGLLKFAPELDVRVYGPESFRDLYPDNYKGWIPFDKARKVFSSSKINICTHIRPDGYKYINERVTQILGCKGLLLVDRVNGIEEVLDIGKECLVIKSGSCKEFADQVSSIIKECDSLSNIKDSGYRKAMEKFTWDCWAEIILENL